MTESHQYDRLEGRCIRVIRVFPALLSRSPLKFDLISTNIDDAPPYVALSYTWDGQTPDRPVWCNGKRLLVTANAETAMRGLRRPRHDLYLWVDAVCINQASLDEKSEQVAMMADIYRSAQHVAIWLGDLGPGVSSA
ncbi:heterokaryon incompatibility protein-domain-containing protein, partial [Staphylotrichum tortipilum]